MKLFAALFCAVMTLAFTGCSKDDFEKDIVGTWKAISITFTEVYDGQSHTETETPEGDSRITFNSDKTYQLTTDGEVVARGTWNIKDDKLTMTITEGDGIGMENATIDIDGSDMTLTMSESYSEGGRTMSITIVMKLKKV